MPKTVRQALISSAVLLLLMIGAMAGYIWYSGQGGPAIQAVDQSAKGATNSPIKPSAPAKDAQESAAVQFITLPVVPCENAMITVKTLPGSSCKIEAVYNNVPAKDSGLITRIANEYGAVSWTWTVPTSTPLGSWPVTTTCSYNGKTAVVVADLVVAKSGTAPAPSPN